MKIEVTCPFGCNPLQRLLCTMIGLFTKFQYLLSPVERSVTSVGPNIYN